MATSAGTHAVTVTPLDAPKVDAVGLLPRSITGLPGSLWQGSDVEQLRRLIARLPTEQLPAAQALRRRLLLAEAAAPAAAAEGVLFEARIDALLAHGLVEEAAAMLGRAGALEGKATDPRLFRRAFDTALLVGQEERACARLKDTPGLTPSLTVRIFCLARNGDWSAAAVTLDTAAALNQVPAGEAALLARFLDPELYEGTPDLAPVQPISPLQFRIFEAIGTPIPTQTLPLAFAHADLRANAGWKPRIAAAERLAKQGALSPNALLGIYSERKAAASGGVWERVAAIQALEAALDSKDPGEVAATLPRAWAEFQRAGLEATFAAIIGPSLAEIPLTGAPAAMAVQIGLLTNGYEGIALDHTPSDAMGRFLVALARGLPETDSAPDELTRAIADGFANPPLKPELAGLAEENRLGEALLLALELAHSGAGGDLDDLTMAIALLRLHGLEDTARRIGLELVLLGPRG